MTAEEPRKAEAVDYDTFVNWDVRLRRETPSIGCREKKRAAVCQHTIRFAH